MPSLSRRLAALVCLLAAVGALAGCGRDTIRYRLRAGDLLFYRYTYTGTARRPGGDPLLSLSIARDLMFQVEQVDGQEGWARATLYNTRRELKAATGQLQPQSDLPESRALVRFNPVVGGVNQVELVAGAGDAQTAQRLEAMLAELFALPTSGRAAPGDRWRGETAAPDPVMEPRQLTVEQRFAAVEQRDGRAVARIEEAGGGEMPLTVAQAGWLERGRGSLTITGTQYLDLRTGLPVYGTYTFHLVFRPDGGGPGLEIELSRVLERR